MGNVIKIPIERLNQLEKRAEEPNESQHLARKGGGDDNGGMEVRLAKLESAVEHIRSDISDVKEDVRAQNGKLDGIRDRMERDFRVTFGAIIAVALGLAGLMAKGFHWL